MVPTPGQLLNYTADWSAVGTAFGATGFALAPASAFGPVGPDALANISISTKVNNPTLNTLAATVTILAITETGTLTLNTGSTMIGAGETLPVSTFYNNLLPLGTTNLAFSLTGNPALVYAGPYGGADDVTAIVTDQSNIGGGGVCPPGAGNPGYPGGGFPKATIGKKH